MYLQQTTCYFNTRKCTITAYFYFKKHLTDVKQIHTDVISVQ